MSNLGELFGIDDKSTSAFKYIFSAIGAIADIAGAVTGIVGAVDTVIGWINGSKDQLAPVLAAIGQLDDHVKAGDIQARLINLNNAWATAQHTIEGLKASLDAIPPLDAGARIAQVGACRDAIDRLIGFDNTHAAGAFLAPFQDQVFYNDSGAYVYRNFVHAYSDPNGNLNTFQELDVGYGYQAPAPDGAGQVFSQIYVLPLILYCECLFITVGLALIPNFFTEYASSISSDADYLMTIHDKIKSGVRYRIPLSWTAGEAWDAAGLFAEAWKGFPTVRGLSQIVTDSGLPIGGDQMAGVRIDYGAVELFSGAATQAQYTLSLTDVGSSASLVNLTGTQLPVEITNLPSNPALYKKFQLRVERQLRDLYRVVGLTDLWQAANKLRGFVGRERLPGPLADYSLRSFCQIVGDGVFDNTRNAYRLSSLHDFVVKTPPQDTTVIPQFVRSLRQVLVI